MGLPSQFLVVLIATVIVISDVNAARKKAAPAPRVIAPFKKLAHGVSSGQVIIKDSRTILIKNLKYDGAGPDAYFWVGKGQQPSPSGRKIPDERGSLDVIRGYAGEDIELILPKGMTFKDIDYLGIWCVAYKHNFGHVNIPKDLNVPAYQP